MSSSFTRQKIVGGWGSPRNEVEVGGGEYTSSKTSLPEPQSVWVHGVESNHTLKLTQRIDESRNQRDRHLTRNIFTHRL